jgi:dTDP-4-dehydrorhamnose 3,5-epimerase
MKVLQTSISGALVLEPRVFTDERGFFLESYSERTLAEIGIEDKFVQDNHSFSRRGVLRGLHYQVQKPQAKLVRVVTGEILDVFLDLRRSSPTFGRWDAATLSAENNRQAWIPVGCAHGFYVLSEGAEAL